MLHKYAMGIIGNNSWLALINDTGNVSWLCWPQFDSSFLFGNLLDKDNGGDFKIITKEEISSSNQSYIKDTNILETTISTKNGTFKISDFAPIYYRGNNLYRPHIFIRKISPLSGTNFIKINCSPTNQYGSQYYKSNIIKDYILFQQENDCKYLYCSKKDIIYQSDEFYYLEKSIYILFSERPLEVNDLEYFGEENYTKTIEYWNTWVNELNLPKNYRDEMVRSALTLQLHVFITGATIAAATTSLPEFISSTRNWDYRFCWMRDSYYTLLAFEKIGNKEVLLNYIKYISQIDSKYIDRWPPLHPISLDREPIEQEISLAGYLNEKPVRIGNQAFEHIQNDIYGQVITTLLPFFTNELISITDRQKYLPIISKLVKKIEETMEDPDNGLWEFRGLKQFHCYTYLFHWAGCKSAIKIATIFNDPILHDLASKNIPKAISKIESCYDKETGLYFQAAGNKNLDASLLQLITMHYLEPENPKAKRLLTALEKNLSTENGLFYRYLHEDDFGKPDVTFLICAFWYIEALAVMGQRDKARSNINLVLKYGNHLNLFSEDVHAKSGSQWGNFPQTYSHAGLIQAVNAIENENYLPPYL
jgi:GH15 family glucan-1,4-alpha-glucosidase